MAFQRATVLDPKDQKTDRSSSEALTCVSVVVPCFNESEAVPYLKQNLLVLVEQGKEDYEFQFILVDDGSNDNTWHDLNEHFGSAANCPSLNCQLIKHPENRGMSAAIQTGMASCENEIVCSIDSDCSYPPNLLLDLLPFLDDDVAMVTASPYHPDGRVKNVPAWRIWLSKRASWGYSLLLKNQLNCYTCAFRVYRRSQIGNIQLDQHGFVGTVELIWKASQLGLRVVERPAVLDVRRYGQSKMRTFSVALKHFRLMARIFFYGLSRQTNKTKP